MCFEKLDFRVFRVFRGFATSTTGLGGSPGRLTPPFCRYIHPFSVVDANVESQDSQPQTQGSRGRKDFLSVCPLTGEREIV
jgi:hypothetical protein